LQLNKVNLACYYMLTFCRQTSHLI
jgi:hypothetical protein